MILIRLSLGENIGNGNYLDERGIVFHWDYKKENNVSSSFNRLDDGGVLEAKLI